MQENKHALALDMNIARATFPYNLEYEISSIIPRQISGNQLRGTNADTFHILRTQKIKMKTVKRIKNITKKME